jgi:tRNA pseudouridine55 synthase
VDKPPGWTSHDVVDAARRWLGTRRVGHLGTLDPLATGVLPLAVREATKLAPFLVAGGKVYRARLHLGRETDTLDAEGRVLREHEGPLPDEASVRAACAAFVGETLQIPPMFSAVKQGGVPLHRLARRGEEVERAPRRVTLERIELRRFEPPELELEVVCSAGTYVRTLAADIGARLGCGAHLAGLRRTRSGPFEIGAAATTDELEARAAAGTLEALLVAEAAGLGLPTLQLGPEEALRVSHGGPIPSPRAPDRLQAGERLAALAPDGKLLAVLERRPDGLLRALRVLRPA